MNNYDNAVPKPLKFLISDGKMIDEQGNVIAESETLKDLYTKWNPEIKKYLLSDGSVVDENNNLIIKNDYYKKMYEQADPKIAKYLHADGTIDENPGGGSEVKTGNISDKMKGFTKEGDNFFYFVYDSEGNLLTAVNDIKTKSLGAVCRVDWADVAIYCIESFENYFENQPQDINPTYDSEKDSIVSENYPEGELFSDVTNWVPTEKLLTKLILYRYS